MLSRFRLMRWMAVGASLLLLAGCGGSGSAGSSGGGPREPGQTATPPSEPVSSSPASGHIELNCETGWADQRVPSGYSVELGAVALPDAATSRQALQAGRRAGDDIFYAKAGLMVRPGRQVELEVTRPAEGAFIGWGGQEMSKKVSTAGCAGSGAWLTFAGGYYVGKPTCLDLRVDVGKKHRTVRIGAGAACPGQKPPPEVR